MIVKVEFVGSSPWGDPAVRTFEHVANVTVPDGITDDDALNFTWRRIQNLDGSWSMGETVDGCDNPDYHESVEVIAALMEVGGKRYGHRSSMVGDRYVVDGRAYIVDIVGFEKEDA